MSFRLALPVLLAALSGLVAQPAAARDLDRRLMTEAGEHVQEVWPQTRTRLLDGDVPAAVAGMLAAVKGEGWQGKLVIGNMTWVMHPVESRAIHEQVLVESKGHPMVRLELALHHTRADECDAALADWQALRGEDNVPPHMALLEAYCQLRKGNDAAAVAAFDRAQVRGHSGMSAYVGLVDELWGPRPSIAVYADRMGAYRQGRPEVTLDALIQAAAELDEDAARFEALQRVADVAATREGAQSPRAAELACLRPWFVAEAEAAAKADPADELIGLFDDTAKVAGRQRRDAALKRCGLMVDGAAWPVNGALGRAVVVWMLEERADPKALLAQYGPVLKARAEARPGDLGALEVLVGLQSAAKDWDGVAASDELGWRTYGVQKFAESRVMGLAIKDVEAGGAMSAATLVRLDEARRQFPTSANLLWIDVMSARAEGEAKAALLRQWVLAEHRSAPTSDPLHATPTNVRLLGAWKQWRSAQGTP